MFLVSLEKVVLSSESLEEIIKDNSHNTYMYIYCSDWYFSVPGLGFFFFSKLH